MKLDCVLTAVNENTMYLDFVPIFIKTWNKLYPGVDVKIILIAKKIPDNFLCYTNNIILFEPIENISTSFTSQFIRELYPCILNYKNGVMITDIENLPMNRIFNTKNIENISDNKWINLRDWKEDDQICMMWQVATPIIWKEVFNINNLQDIKETLINVYNSVNYVDSSYTGAWFTDQKFLYKKVMIWNKKTNNYIFLRDKDTGYARLDRRTPRFERNIKKNPTIKNNIKNGIYSDYQCCRPMDRYSKLNYEIYNLL